MEQHTEGIILKSSGITCSFLETGDIREILADKTRLNCFTTTEMSGAAAGIWLRIYKDGAVSEVYPLWGEAGGGTLSVCDNSLSMKGCAGGVEYCVRFLLLNSAWVWQVHLTGRGTLCDVLYGQDIGVADRGAVLTNELYAAQYLGNRIFEDGHGCVICSRQNQPQHDDTFPALQQGMLKGRSVAYSTDGTQFFGLKYKFDGIPAAFYRDLPSVNYQFELSYTGLQSEKIALDGENELAFYAAFRPHVPEAIEAPFPVDDMIRQMELLSFDEEKEKELPSIRIKEEFGGLYSSMPWTEEKINSLWPRRIIEEREENRLLSFFTEDHRHVVSAEKELLCERPHGHIITTCINPEKIEENLMTSTNYIYGMFNAQTVVGNTSFHKLISVARGLLNQGKHLGQRLWVRMDGKYRLLSMPSVYEMGMNFARWYYEIDGELLTVTVFSVSDRPGLVLEVKGGKDYDFLLTTQLVLGEQEFEQDFDLSAAENRLLIRPGEKWREKSPYPQLNYLWDVKAPSVIFSDDRLFFEDNKTRDSHLLTCRIDHASGFRVQISGSLYSPALSLDDCDFKSQKEAYDDFYRRITANASLSLENASPRIAEELAALNTTFWWYSQNALVHFAVPHGLEQTGGAAWGTRDVCQGPFEFFMATGHFALVRDILLRLYSNQSRASGEWPQWFMFDRYTQNAGSCHGDVVFWPLKCIGDYLLATGDFSILKVSIGWLEEDRPAQPLMDHILRAASQYEKRFLPGTALISYAGGDWDDTLQPAQPEMKAKLVSAWTQCLAYQTANILSMAMREYAPEFSLSMEQTASRLKEDYEKYLVINGVPAGFVYLNDNGIFEPMLHPDDQITGIHYRLLPLTRSILSQAADKNEAEKNLKLIEEHLRCPDGVRLMDFPAHYSGGVSRLFRRAEQAANVGREISLQYVHAHIRFIEALAKAGKADEAWRSLFTINPIGIQKAVKNAKVRQANQYFSSSDPCFDDRYSFEREFVRVKNGTVEVKGGWRLYSSGPGIYLSRLIGDLLGIRIVRDGLLIDPVLPAQLDGLRFTMNCFGRKITFLYTIQAKEKKVNNGGHTFSDKPVFHPYRTGGMLIRREDIQRSPSAVMDNWEIYL